MATADQVRERRAENERLREQIAAMKSKQADDLAAANNDIALERADREHQSLEAELAALMGNRVSSEVSAAPTPDTLLVSTEVVPATSPESEQELKPVTDKAKP
jgi:uncharacterized protein YdaU (DUF1376 family)